MFEIILFSIGIILIYLFCIYLVIKIGIRVERKQIKEHLKQLKIEAEIEKEKQEEKSLNCTMEEATRQKTQYQKYIDIKRKLFVLFFVFYGKVSIETTDSSEDLVYYYGDNNASHSIIINVPQGTTDFVMDNSITFSYHTETNIPGIFEYFYWIKDCKRKFKHQDNYYVRISDNCSYRINAQFIEEELKFRPSINLEELADLVQKFEPK